MKRLALSVLLLLSGCAAVPIAALGTVLGVGATAVSTGASVYSLGKLNSAENASAAEVRHAAQLMADELDFKTLDGGFDEKKLVYTYTFADRLGTKLKVVVAERSARLCRLRIDVGLFGNEPTARLVLLKIRSHLPDAAATTRPVEADE